MKASEAFPSKWIAAADLSDKNVRLTISHVEMEDIGDDRKPVIYFQNAKKGLVCNKTNSKSIVAAYGDEMDDWAGCELILFPIMTEYQGTQVPAVRVRAPQPKDNKLATCPGVGFGAVERGDIIGIGFIQDHAFSFVLKIQNHFIVVADFFLFNAIYYNRNITAFQV